MNGKSAPINALGDCKVTEVVGTIKMSGQEMRRYNIILTQQLRIVIKLIIMQDMLTIQKKNYLPRKPTVVKIIKRLLNL